MATEILVENARIWRPRWRGPHRNFAEIFGLRKMKVHGVRRCFRDAMLNCFGRRTYDGRTHDDSVYHAVVASRGKSCRAAHFLTTNN